MFKNLIIEDKIRELEGREKEITRIRNALDKEIRIFFESQQNMMNKTMVELLFSLDCDLIQNKLKNQSLDVLYSLIINLDNVKKLIEKEIFNRI